MNPYVNWCVAIQLPLSHRKFTTIIESLVQSRSWYSVQIDNLWCGHIHITWADFAVYEIAAAEGCKVDEIELWQIITIRGMRQILIFFNWNPNNFQTTCMQINTQTCTAFATFICSTFQLRVHENVWFSSTIYFSWCPWLTHFDRIRIGTLNSYVGNFDPLSFHCYLK